MPIGRVAARGRQGRAGGRTGRRPARNVLVPRALVVVAVGAAGSLTRAYAGRRRGTRRRMVERGKAGLKAWLACMSCVSP